MANPAPTINQINAFNATQGTTIDFNIIGGTELVRSNRIYIYDLSDNSLICTHLYVSTESIHELPPNTDGSIVYESGKSSADFVNGAQYYAQIQTFTDIAGTEGGSGLSVAKMFWCLVDPTLTITTIPSTISTTSYNVSATYNANTSVVSNIIQQYQFSLYSATGSLLQSSGVVVGSGTQQGTSTAYDISYNFTGLSVGSSYYVVVDVTTTQGMSVSAQSSTFTVSIDTPTLGEATVVNNACDGYISVTSNLSGEYGGSGSGEIVSFETDSENVFTKLQVDLEPIQDLHGYDAPWVGGAGINKLPPANEPSITYNGITITHSNGVYIATGETGSVSSTIEFTLAESVDINTSMYIHYHDDAIASGVTVGLRTSNSTIITENSMNTVNLIASVKSDGTASKLAVWVPANRSVNFTISPMLMSTNTATNFTPYENICPISAPTTSPNLLDLNSLEYVSGGGITFTHEGDTIRATGTATTQGYKGIAFTLPEAGTYHFKMNATNGGKFLKGFTDKGTEFTDTITDATQVYRIATPVTVIGTEYDITYSEIQVVKGDTAIEPYRPYGENISLTHTGDNLIDDTLRNYSNIVTLPEGTWYAQAFIYATSEINTRLDYINENGVWTSILNSPLETPTFSTEGTYTFGWAYTAGTNPKTMTLHVTKPTTFRFTTQTLNDTRRLSLSRTKKNSLSEFVEYQRCETRYFETLQANLYDPNNLQIGKAWNGDTNSSRAIVWMPCQPNQEVTVTIEGGNFDAIYWFEKTSEDSRSNNRSYAPPSFPYHVTTTATSQVMGIQFNKTAISANDFDGVKIRVVWGKHDGAIYNGHIDLVSGGLTVTHGYVDLGTLNWTYENTSSYMRFYSTGLNNLVKKPSSDYETVDMKCSALKVTNTSAIWQGTEDGIIAFGATGTLNARIKAYTTAEAFKTAMNGVKLVYPLATPITIQLTPQEIQTLVGVNNVWSEQGDVELSYHIPITNLLVKRQDVGDVSGDWLTLYSQPITQASDMDFTFIDFLNQYGKTYKYALVPLLIQTQSGVEVEVEGGYTVSDEVQSIFDGVFIADQTGLQKCKANVGYGNVDMNQVVGSIMPIGAQYPVVITNSKNQYHNGSISGTIVPDDYYFNGNLSRIDMVNKRNELEQFLTNKRAKIIKDWNSNIWLVMIMDNVNCTFNNNYGMGIVNFSTSWVEVGDPTNQQDLQATGLINIGGV